MSCLSEENIASVHPLARKVSHTKTVAVSADLNSTGMDLNLVRMNLLEEREKLPSHYGQLSLNSVIIYRKDVLFV